MAKSFAFRYASLVGCIAFIFVNFVACGAQMYQVSMQNDITVPPSGGGVSDEESSDPNHHYYGLHAPNGWRELPIRFRVGLKLQPHQVSGLQAAMKSWETAVGRKLFEYLGEDEQFGDKFDDLYSSLNDDTNGHYADYHWDKTGKKREVLATTIWDNELADSLAIKTADIRFNADYYVIGDSLSLTSDGDREVVDMETLALHELGHLLGLAHVNPDRDPDSIMVPSLFIGEGLYSRLLSKGDVRRIQQIYGCQKKACNLEKVMSKLETRSRMSLAELEEDDRHSESERDRNRDEDDEDESAH